MPPIPSTLDEQITTVIDSLRRRQKDLSEFQIPRLRTCKGPLATQQGFAAELREDLDTFSKQVETLDVAVDDQRTERNRRELRQIVEEFRDSLTRLKRDVRTALLVSKRTIDADQLSNRDELLRSSAVKEKQDLNEKVAEDALMKANNDVTQSLQRTINLMQGELERSVLSTQLLDTSTAALRSTSSTHDVLDSLLVTSKHLITALEKSDWLDRLLVLAGLAFFVLVVLFILKQRLVDRSLRIALWWTRFVPNFSGDEVLMQMEEGKEVVKGAAGAVTSVLTTVATAASSVLEAAPSAIPGTDTVEPSQSTAPDVIAVASLPSSDTTSSSAVSFFSSVESGMRDEL